MKDAKILKKISRLLSMYGVDDEEKNKFMTDLQDAKYDDPNDDEEETVEEEKVEETENVEGEEETGGNTEEAEKVEETETEEKEVGEDAEDSGSTDAEPEEPVETPVEEPAPEEPAEELPPQEENGVQEVEQPGDVPTEDPNQVDREAEYKATIEALEARIASLENVVQKLGTPAEENPIGVEPTNPSGESAKESEFDTYNRLRTGR